MAERSPGDWPADQGRSLLPVEWSSPWQRLRNNLANDLPAVSAALWLKWQELWRRNRDGDLSIPGFWPGTIKPLFWPAVLMALLALPLGAGLSWRQAARPAPAAVVPLDHPTPPLQRPAQPLPLLPLEPAQGEAPVQHEPFSAEREPVAAESPSEASADVDPLFKLLQADAETQWFTAVEVRSDRNELQLTLSDGFMELPIEQRQQRADQWLDQVQQLGYDTLELVSARGALLGRSAQVGSGMILWNAPIP